MKTLEGIAWVYGDDIDTDNLFPGKYLDLTDPEEMASHALEGLDPSFVRDVRPGDFIVAGRNFGCGSSREQAAVVLREKRVAAVVATSFARIFYRNAVNVGVPPVVAPSIVKVTRMGDRMRLDLSKGIVENLTREQKEYFVPFPSQILHILSKGGLVPYLRDKIKAPKKTH
ncbi:MAG: LeuD/DmdB family oxidoreductase small subunit [Candidatus Ranarchaeia archaeon]